MVRAADFARAAEHLQGTRWRMRGRNPSIGLDCAGLVIAAARAVGVELRDSTDYCWRFPPPELLRNFCDLNAEDVALGDAGEGRVGVCRPRQGVGASRHLVVMLSGRRIAHVDAHVRRVAVVPASWLDGRLLSVWRLRGVEYGPPWSAEGRA